MMLPMKNLVLMSCTLVVTVMSIIYFPAYSPSLPGDSYYPSGIFGLKGNVVINHHKERWSIRAIGNSKLDDEYRNIEVTSDFSQSNIGLTTFNMSKEVADIGIKVSLQGNKSFICTTCLVHNQNWAMNTRPE